MSEDNFSTPFSKYVAPNRKDVKMRYDGNITCLKITDQHIEFPLETSIIIVTDIIDSTKLYNENPTKMQFYLESHKKVVKCLIRRYSGHVVANEGDSFTLVFQHLENAIKFSKEFIDTHNEYISFFKVRMAINKGKNLCFRKICGFKVFGKPIDEALELFKHNIGNVICIKESLLKKYNLRHCDDMFCIH